MLKESSLSLITASTDGHFTIWNLTSKLEPFYSLKLATVYAKQPLHTLEISPEHVTCESRYRIHSNSVKSLEMVNLSNTASLIVTGGDDNALSLSLVITDPTNPEANACVSTVIIPDAHAASVVAAQQGCPANLTQPTHPLQRTHRRHHIHIRRRRRRRLALAGPATRRLLDPTPTGFSYLYCITCFRSPH